MQAHMTNDTVQSRFYGFFNFALRNSQALMETTANGTPQRASQINAFLRRNGLEDDAELYASDYLLHCFTQRATELANLVRRLTNELGQDNLEKLAETKDRNIKLMILEHILRKRSDKPKFRGLRICDFQNLSYRKRIYRSLQTLTDLKLVARVRTVEYEVTRKGEPTIKKKSSTTEYDLTEKGESIIKQTLSTLQLWEKNPL